MSAIAADLYAMTDAVLTLGTDTFEDAVNRAEFVPSYTNPTFDSINGKTHVVGDAATWVLNLSLGKDFKTTGSLANYLAEHDGEKVTAVLEDGGGKQMSATVLIRAVGFGGTAKQVPTADVTLPVSGTAPVLAAAS